MSDDTAALAASFETVNETDQAAVEAEAAKFSMSRSQYLQTRTRWLRRGKQFAPSRTGASPPTVSGGAPQRPGKAAPPELPPEAVAQFAEMIVVMTSRAMAMAFGIPGNVAEVACELSPGERKMIQETAPLATDYLSKQIKYAAGAGAAVFAITVGGTLCMRGMALKGLAKELKAGKIPVFPGQSGQAKAVSSSAPAAPGINGASRETVSPARLRHPMAPQESVGTSEPPEAGNRLSPPDTRET